MTCGTTKHSFKTITMWTPVEFENENYTSRKIKVSTCRHCGFTRQTPISERIRYGAGEPPYDLDNVLEGEMLELTRSLLLDLIKSKTRKRWENWKAHWLTHVEYQLFDESVMRLFNWGLLVMHEKKLHNRIQTWDPKFVSANLGMFESDIARLMEMNFDTNTAELDSLTMAFQDLKPLTENEHLIKKVIQFVKIKRDSSTIHMIRLLFALFDHNQKQKTMSWKMFSQQYFYSTKALSEGDKHRLRKLLGKKLSDFGIHSNKSRIWITGPFSWELNGYTNYGLAFHGSLSLTRSMIHKMRIISWDSPHLLIIENKDLFDSLVDSQWLDPCKWSLLYSKGFISSEEIELISYASTFNLVSITIWPDFDPFGLSIAINIKEKLMGKALNIPVKIFGFTKEWGERFPGTSPLTKSDLNEIYRLMTYPIPHACIEALHLMKSTNRKGEQELCFDFFTESDFERHLSQDVVQLI
ncbi:hypothetical protein AK95_03270 [Paenibacillus sp. LC231]|uniref:Wadjet protein JetD C-terminal domain-containing protein n=2 Tax=Paenibacillus TaxID=44249 RepID=A0A163GEP6_9BACL|nr:hypothetical protein AWU65_02805 [Paenibacillus glucanolyticus]OIB01936.1 hypothetical protein AK95_03270 [Paenibacillus sp. LC231]OMF65522.1 hypothetical protein BK142_30715 [Paenibacillus glucanolyticus]